MPYLSPLIMVYRQISSDMKKRALQLLEEGWEVSEIADAPGVSTKSIPRWHNNYEIHGCVNPPSALHGRRRILTGEVIDGLRRLEQESPELYLPSSWRWGGKQRPQSLKALLPRLARTLF